jgi:hypothetical protein
VRTGQVSEMEKCMNIPCKDQDSLCCNGCMRYDRLVNLATTCPDFSAKVIPEVKRLDNRKAGLID